MKFFGKKNKNKLDNQSMKKGVRMVSVTNPQSINSEQFNTVRTNIEFSNSDFEYKSIMISSATSSEGKSTISANLAVSFARQGKKVVLVDTDFRRATVNATFNINNAKGLTNYLTKQVDDILNVIYGTSIDNLFVLPSGPFPPNPSELISSNRMSDVIESLKRKYDVIIYDAPPILAVSDSQILATKVDGTILTVRADYTEKSEISEAVKRIQGLKARIIGTILNDVHASGDGYYGYGYYKSEK